MDGSARSNLRRRVLFFIPTLAGGGAERVFSILLRHLDRRRFEPHLAVLRAQGEYMSDIPGDVVIHDLKISRARYALPAIVKLVWKTRPQAILSTLGHLNTVLISTKALLPRGTRLLVRESVTSSVVLPEETGHPGFWQWLYRHLYNRADKVVCLSDAMMNDMAEHFSVRTEKLVRIYNPVEVERVRELSQTGGNPFSGPGPHLVAAGRLCRAKGFDLLLDAMPIVRKHLPGAELAILGDGGLRAALEEHAQALDLGQSVRFLGFRQNPWLYFRHADLFVLSSRYEGLPNVVLEALALETPVVATDCPGAIREIHDCSDGMVVVRPEDPQALAEAIVSVCHRPKIRHEAGVRTRPDLSRFDLYEAVAAYSKLLLN